MSGFHRKRAPLKTVVSAIFAALISLVVLFFALYFLISGYLGKGQSFQTLLLEILPACAALLLAWGLTLFFLKRRVGAPSEKLRSSLQSLSDTVSKGARLDPEETERDFQDLRDELSSQSEKLLSLLKYTQKKTGEEAAQREKNALARRIAAESVATERTLTGADYHLSYKLSRGKGLSFDYADAFRIDGETVFFAIGDIWGQGIDAALFLNKLKNGLKTGVLSGKLLSKVMTTVNAQLYADNQASIGATLFAGVYNFVTHELHFVNMGHFAPIAIGSGASYLRVRAGTPLGLYEKVTPSEERIELLEGQGLVFCTEGVLLAAGEGRMLGFRRTNMTAHALANNPKAAEEILKSLGATPDKEEDAAVLVLRYYKEPKQEEGNGGSSVAERARNYYKELFSKPGERH